MAANEFHVEPIPYDTGLAELRAVREPVFVAEQGVPLELEWDELDPACHHVIARDADGHPIGTGRLTPEHRIGRQGEQALEEALRERMNSAPTSTIKPAALKNARINQSTE